MSLVLLYHANVLDEPYALKLLVLSVRLCIICVHTACLITYIYERIQWSCVCVWMLEPYCIEYTCVRICTCVCSFESSIKLLNIVSSLATTTSCKRDTNNGDQKADDDENIQTTSIYGGSNLKPLVPPL